MENSVLFIRAGLFLDALGAILIGLDLIGTARIKRLDGFAREQIKTSTNPKKLVRKLIRPTFPINLILTIAYLLFVTIFVNVVAANTTLLIKFQAVTNSVPGGLYAILLTGVVAAVSLETIWELKKIKNRPIFRALELVFILPMLPVFILMYLSFFSVGTLIWGISCLSYIPLQIGFLLQEKFGFRAALPSSGIFLIFMGFLLQFVGTF